MCTQPRVCECLRHSSGSAIVAVCGCMNSSETMNEAAVQTVSGETADKATYPQRCFITVIITERHAFTYVARYSLIEIT